MPNNVTVTFDRCQRHLELQFLNATNGHRLHIEDINTLTHTLAIQALYTSGIFSLGHEGRLRQNLSLVDISRKFVHKFVVYVVQRKSTNKYTETFLS